MGVPMARFAVFALPLLLVVALVMLINSWSDTPAVETTPPADLSAVVALPNGSVLTAPKGSVGRDMVDWLASDDDTERRFELGGREFDGRSIEPTMESKVRIERGVAILKANPKVSLEVIGYTAATADAAADLKLGQARADWVVNALHDGGIASSRMTAHSRGGADPIGDNATAEGRAKNERVAMILRHQH
ncbi:OmpA family protein [Sphingomonas crocodyli]|uniref:OmpA family protein n=2 Tax=Sphingomonas crocodyli TaxID=1979270 RepID=A0A437MAA0_9SPHN|nr:OmpA family protein [Sphingomonas crocodyli]